MVSMKDIAEQCAVSVATVSKALNDRTDISEETRNRIRKVAKEMGYFPNSSARALKTNRTYNLGVLFYDQANSGLTHSYFSAVLDSFRKEAEEYGYDITFISNRTGTGTMSYYEHSKYRGVDGVMIACVDFEEESVKELAKGDIPVVTIDFAFDNRTSVLSDNITGMQEIVHYIVENGHTKVAYIHGEDSSVTRNRVGCFHRTLAELGIEVPDEYVREGIYHDTKSSQQITTELLALKDRPTCIVFPDDFSCIGGINAIENAGLHIPEDISVVGFDGQQVAKVMEPKIATYKQDTKAIGKTAAKKLIEAIENPKTALIERIVVKGELVHGKSVRKL